jgi:hypothetical protein
MARVTLTVDRELLEEARMASEGNLSRFVSSLLREQLDLRRRRALEEELRAGYLAEAETDLAIVHDYRFVDGEAAGGEDS